jgi:hypothetical protein
MHFQPTGDRRIAVARLYFERLETSCPRFLVASFKPLPFLS